MGDRHRDCARGQQTKIRIPAHDLIIGSRVGSPAPPGPPRRAVARVLHRRDDPMGARLERAGGMGPFVRIDSDDDHERPPAQTRRRGAGPRTTCRLPAPVAGTPLIESGHSPRHRPTRQALAEPTRTRQAVHEPSRSMPRRDARSPNPARPVHLIQVGGSVSALARLAHLARQLGVGDRAGITRLALPAEGDLLTMPASTCRSTQLTATLSFPPRTTSRTAPPTPCATFAPT